MSDYPTGIDTFRAQSNIAGHEFDSTKETTIYAEDFTGRSDAIIAIEETLGIDPQGASATVDARISAVESGKQAVLGFTPEDVANKSTTTSLGTSDILYPSQKAVKTYVDTAISGVGSSNPILQSGNLSQYSGGFNNGNTVYAMTVLCMATGSINRMAAFCTTYRGSTSTVDFGIYDNSNNLLGHATATLSGTGLLVATISTPISLTAGTLYKLAFTLGSSDFTSAFAYATIAGGQTALESHQNSNSTLPSTYAPSANDTHNYWLAAWHS